MREQYNRPMPPPPPPPEPVVKPAKSPELERYQNLRNLLNRLPSVVDYPRDYPNSPRLSKIVHRDITSIDSGTPEPSSQQQIHEVKRGPSVESATSERWL